MILQPIKNGNILSPFIILLFAIILWGGALFSPINISFLDFGILQPFLRDFSFESNKIAVVLICFSTIIATGLIINRAIDRDEFFPKNNFLPFFFYVLFMSISEAQRGFSPIIFSNVFLLLFFVYSIKIKRQDDAREIIFNASFFLSTAILIFPVYLPLSIASFMLLIVFRPFVWREWALAILGLLLPAFFYFSYLYFFDMNLSENVYKSGFDLNWNYTKERDTFASVFSGFIMLLVFLSLIILNRIFNSSSLRLRKFIQFFILTLALFAMINISIYSFNEFLFPAVAVPLSLFLSYYFYYAKPFWGNVFFYLLIGLSIYSVYFA
jgi:hypothetical protein